MDSSDVILSHTDYIQLSQAHIHIHKLTSVGSKHDESQFLASVRIQFAIRHFRPGSHIGRRIVPRSAWTRSFTLCPESVCDPLALPCQLAPCIYTY